MLTLLKKTTYAMGAAMTMGMMTTQDALAIQDIPGLLTAVSYLLGLLLGVLGVLKIKDHVENPTQTPIKEGAIRLASGGALFALPIIFDSMFNTVDGAGIGGDTTAATLNKVQFNVAP